jgi:hypothetical protein
MKTRRLALVSTTSVLACGLLAPYSVGAQHPVRQATDGRPDAVIDLRTKEVPISFAVNGDMPTRD